MALRARRSCFLLAAVAVLASGCAMCPKKIQQALHRPTNRSTKEMAAKYTLACPDTLSIKVPTIPAFTGVYAVAPDGCVALGELGRVRVDGATTDDVADLVAKSLRLSPSQVQVEVVEHASRYVLMIGPADGVQRVVPYQGPEPVTDCLRRCGGLSPGAAFNAIHVVRPHVAAGKRPEVFPVDLEAIVMKNDAATDVVLEPYDQVYLGETRGAGIVRSLPPWLRQLCPRLRDVDDSTAAKPE